MRKFVSYGPVNPNSDYYAPREALIERTLTHLVGGSELEGGHYITVWGPRQTGKTWLMQQILWRLHTEPAYQDFAAVKINLQTLKEEHDLAQVFQAITAKLGQALGLVLPPPETRRGFESLLAKEVLKQPLILILDEFDALEDSVMSGVVDAFRNIYLSRRDQLMTPPAQKDYLLHGLALIGVRAVLGSKISVDRSLTYSIVYMCPT